MNVFQKWAKDGMWDLEKTRSGHVAILVFDNEVYNMEIDFGENPTEGEVEPKVKYLTALAERPRKDARQIIEANLKKWVEEAKYFIIDERGVTAFYCISKDGLKKINTKGTKGQAILMFYYYKHFESKYNMDVKQGEDKKYLTYKEFLNIIYSKHKDIKTMEAAIEYAKNNLEEFERKENPIDIACRDFDPNSDVISIKRPVIERDSSNKNGKTFDFVEVEILLRSTLVIDDMEKYVKERLSEWDAMVR